MFQPMSMFFTNYGTFSFSPEKPRVVSISSFDEVVLIKPKPLILCDIDETLLTFDKDYSHFVNLSSHTYDTVFRQFNIPTQYISREKHREAKVNSMAKLAYDAYIHDTGPKPTDIDGFNRLVKRARLLGGNVKFLTARGEKSQTFTRNNFQQIGVNYDDFEVHYTNAGPKGEYIKKNIPLEGYNEVFFIDDLDQFIENVSSNLPEIVCYKFVKSSENTTPPSSDFAI